MPSLAIFMSIVELWVGVMTITALFLESGSSVIEIVLLDLIWIVWVMVSHEVANKWNK